MIRPSNIFRNPEKKEWFKLTERPALGKEILGSLIDDVFDAVEKDGDRALLTYTERFDNINLDAIEVKQIKIENARENITDSLRSAIDSAFENIERFHRGQVDLVERIETVPGVTCWRESRPIEKVGLYIPGGSAPLFSTVLMLGIPALIAGCKEVVLCTPPDSNGDIHPAILYAAKACGVHRVFKLGGIQAIAAMAIGSESVPKVYKIFGPGNQFVTQAKMKALSLGTAIDLPAGPSELLVYADSTANTSFVASDLLSQAEHGQDSQVILVSTEELDYNLVNEELKKQSDSMPRKEVIEKALDHAKIISFQQLDDAFAFINDYAPEHLILACDDAEKHLKKITNAGSVFLGHYSPESAGDYASGTNHTLPTAGFAKSYSGVSLDSFVKKISFQKISKKGLKMLRPTLVEMAEAEQLRAHASAVRIRFKNE